MVKPGSCLFKVLYMLLVLSNSASLVVAQEVKLNIDKNLEKGIKQLNAAYDAWELAPFNKAVDIFEKTVTDNPDNYISHYWQGVSYYFIASFYLHARDKDRDEAQGKRVVAKGIDSLKKAVKLNSEDSESYALLGVLQGMMIKMNPWSAFSNGPQVEQNRNRALALNPENPRVHYLTGISLYMTPELFGGSSEKALEHMLKAIVLFEKENSGKYDPITPRWGYHTCLAFIGDIYYKKKEYKLAYRYYQKSLLINPRDQIALEGLERISQQ